MPEDSIALKRMSSRGSYEGGGEDIDEDEDMVLIDDHHSEDSAPLIARKHSPNGLSRNAVKKRGADRERRISAATALPSNKNYKFASNAISNAKYSPITFIPIILFEQFKFFFNLYFLLVALSQAVPALRIGYLSSYIVPLAFVLTVTMGKEAWDDIQRRRRDKDSNTEKYDVIDKAVLTQSKDLKVGNLVRLHKNQRVPADMVLLQSSEASGESFIRTDQLDGETDWKLRYALRSMT